MAKIIDFQAAREKFKFIGADYAKGGDKTVVIPFPGAAECPARQPDPQPSYVQFLAEAQKAHLTTRARRPTPNEPREKQAAGRNNLLARIHILLEGNKSRGQLGLYQLLEGFNESAYRYALREKFGKESAAELDYNELRQCLMWLKSIAPAGYGKTVRRSYGQHDMIKRIEQLLAEKGKIQSRFAPFEYAEGILERQTRKQPGGPVKSLYDANPKQLRAVIAALDKDGRRGKKRQAKLEVM